MPRTADHAARKQRIVEALWRVAAERGLPAVSFREVAAEAGVSVRQVQYYFGTKAQLLAESIQLLGGRVIARGIAGMGELGPNPAKKALVRAAIVGALPRDEESRTDALLFLTFYMAAMTDRSLASAQALDAPRLSVMAIIELLRQAKADGETRPDVDPDKDGRLIVAANTGTIISLLAGLQTYDDALAAMDHQLDRLFQ